MCRGSQVELDLESIKEAIMAVENDPDAKQTLRAIVEGAAAALRAIGEAARDE